MRLDHAMLAPSRQQGAALIAVLIILVVITLLGVTAMRMSLTGLTLAQSHDLNARLVLLLANQVGDHELLKATLAAARRSIDQG